MSTTTIALFAVVAVSLAAMGLASNDALAQPSVTTTYINDHISIQKTEVTLSVPLDNTLPWGFVTGQPSESVPNYPVIIQFHQNGEAVHFAQVETNDDGSYEYRFRVLSVDLETGKTTHVFGGDYDVSIFKVVPSTNSKDVPLANTI